KPMLNCAKHTRTLAGQGVSKTPKACEVEHGFRLLSFPNPVNVVLLWYSASPASNFNPTKLSGSCDQCFLVCAVATTDRTAARTITFISISASSFSHVIVALFTVAVSARYQQFAAR